MIKSELRLLYKEKKKQLTESQKLKLDDLLLIQFQYLSFEHVQNLLSYWPIDAHREVNTHIMTQYLNFRIPSLQIAFPVLDRETNSFTALAVDGDTEFEKNNYGIMEPVNAPELPAQEIDLVFVPLLCFDRKGYRVGYGKGYYDRYLKGCREDTIKVGFSYFDPVDTIGDISDFDVPLNLCITPNPIYDF
jgi:5-formyltetrahydrofolate cyclo-ligase